MELTQNEKKKIRETTKAEMLRLSHGISIADKMLKVSGARIKLELEGRTLDAVYYPAPAAEEEPPLIVGFHGGGFVFGGCALNDAMWVAVTEKLRAPVISVGYRQGEKHAWKDSLKDAVDTINYLSLHAHDFQADFSRIFLMGQSAGALLATTAALKMNLDRKGMSPGDEFDNIVPDGPAINTLSNIQNCIMLYPLLDVATESDEKGDGSLKGPVCDVFQEVHCSDGNERNPLVSPIYASSEMLEGMPPTIIVTSENDNLRHEGFKYAKMLEEAGVSVAWMMAEGMPHAYFESGFKNPTDFEKQFLGENADELVESGAMHDWSVKTLEFIKENLAK